MGMIRIYQGKSKPANKKPGWAEREAEEKAWLAKINSMSLGITKWKPTKPVARLQSPVKDGTLVIAKERLVKGKSLNTIVTGGTKQVPRPEIKYKDDPEMLARELAARERKFNVAPAFNKAGDSYVTEEELENVLRSNKRRS